MAMSAFLISIKKGETMKRKGNSLIRYFVPIILLILLLPCLIYAAPLDDWALMDSGTPNLLYGATYSANTFVAVGNYGTIRMSTDGGTSWNSSTNSDTHHLYGTTYGNNGTGLYVSVGVVNTILTSPDLSS